MYTFFFEALGTHISVLCSEKCDEDMVKQEVLRIEKKFSRFSEDSILSLLCKNGGGRLDNETLFLWEKAEEFFEKSNGIFDVGVGKILSHWGYGKHEQAHESDFFSFACCTRNKNEVHIPAGCFLDFGGFGKGYALDCCAQKMQSSSFCLNFGGDLLLKNFPNEVGLQSPFSKGEILGYCEMENGVLCASGGYERQFFGKNHLVNVQKKDVATGAAAVFVQGKTAIIADFLATTLCIQPFLENVEDFEMEIFCVLPNETMLKSEGFHAVLF